MIAKAFEKFNYTTVIISNLLLLGISVYYTTLEVKWSFFESQILNGIIIFGAFLLTSYSIDTVARQIILDRSNTNAYHLLMYPLIILAYPVESVDLRFILSSAAMFSAWRNFRIFLETKREALKTRRLFDTSILLSLSTLLIIENIYLFALPFALLLSANIKRDIKHFVLLLITPIILIPTIYIFIKTLSLEFFLFSSYFVGNEFSLTSQPTFTVSQAPLALIFLYYVAAVFSKRIKGVSLQRRAIDLASVLFLVTPFIVVLCQEDKSGSEYHYFSLILVYFIVQLFLKNRNSSIVNFIFMSLIASIIIFNFLL
ncbi:MAG: hypothetical protein HOD45_02605 [Cryomorphaceae bacterium]|nr:hypothetical protein [Cryomorphaceae bacterium]